jgi:hypothetical protein
MNAPRLPQFIVPLIAAVVLLQALQSPARAAQGAEFITAVASTASKDYVRVKLSDGSFQPENYSFGIGGKWSGVTSDDTIDKLVFMDVARVISVPLANQNYLPAKDPKTTKLLIMVYWGTTQVSDPMSTSAAFVEYGAIRSEIGANPLPVLTKPSSGGMSLAAMNNAPQGDDAQMNELSAALTMVNVENTKRERLDYKNAQMLGYDSYDSSGLVGTDRGNWLGYTPLGAHQHDLVEEIESSRYFIVLMAYDFQVMWKQKKHKLLWETRFSINQPHNDFTKALPAMALYASKYFGQNSHGLIREPIRVGNVTVGEPTLVELLSDPKK